jgi:hypothetical protein
MVRGTAVLTFSLLLGLTLGSGDYISMVVITSPETDPLVVETLHPENLKTADGFV